MKPKHPTVKLPRYMNSEAASYSTWISNITTTKMKKWLILTSSESCDHYQYFVMHPKQPTDKELARFLKEHACDKDNDEVYEDVDSVTEIIETDFLTIPKK